MERRNLSNVSQLSTQNFYQSYLTIFAINLLHRVPNGTDASQIDDVTVRHVAELSYTCARIAQDTWDELSQTSGRDVRQQQRSA